MGYAARPGMEVPCCPGLRPDIEDKALKKISVLALAGFLLVVGTGAALAQSRPVIRFSFGSGWNALPAIVAIERGFFAQQGLTVSGMAVSSAAAVMQSIAVGSTDFATVPQRTLLVMAAAKLPVTVISMNGWGTQLELVVRKGDKRVRSLRDLKGKKIAVGAASDAYPVLIRLLNAAKMRPSDVVIQPLPAARLVTALKSKRADAVFAFRHFTSVLVQSKQGRVVMDNARIVKALGRVGATPLLVNNRLLKTQPKTVQKFVTAWVRALKYIQKDPRDAANLLRIYFHRQGVTVSNKLAASWIPMTRYDRYVWSRAAIADAEYNGWGLKAGKVLKIRPKLAGYIQNRFAVRALKAAK